MKKYSISLLVGGLSLIMVKPAYAHCPLCVAGAGAGLSLSRVLGIDDSITGIWLGAFLGSMSFWTNNSINKTYILGQKFWLYLFVFISTIYSFYRFGLVNEHNGLLLNLPKLIFGMLVGGILFYLIDIINNFIRQKKGKVLFNYQPMVFSLGVIVIASLVMFGLLNYFI